MRVALLFVIACSLLLAVNGQTITNLQGFSAVPYNTNNCTGTPLASSTHIAVGQCYATGGGSFGSVQGDCYTSTPTGGGASTQQITILAFADAVCSQSSSNIVGTGSATGVATCVDIYSTTVPTTVLQAVYVTCDAAKLQLSFALLAILAVVVNFVNKF